MNKKIISVQLKKTMGAGGRIFGLTFLSLILALAAVYLILGPLISWNPIDWYTSGPDQQDKVKAAEEKPEETDDGVEKFSFCRW